MINCDYILAIIFGMILSYMININYKNKLLIIECKEKFENKCNNYCFN